MVNCQSWFTLKKQNTIAVNGKEVYKSLYLQINQKLKENIIISEIVDWIKGETIQKSQEIFSQKPTTGSLNNCLGAWNEYIATTLLSEIVIELNQNNKHHTVIFALPKTQIIGQEKSTKVSSKFITLFNEQEFIISNQLAKFNYFKDKIFFSSPDFIVAVIEESETQNYLVINQLLEKQAQQPYSLEIYEYLKGKLKAAEIKAIISLKTSYRGDRRYQPLFEAAMIKSMAYMFNINWKYYVVASEVSSADTKLFNTIIAPHGIALGQYFKLVDATYIYSKKQDLVPLIQDVIN